MREKGRDFRDRLFARSGTGGRKRKRPRPGRPGRAGGSRGTYPAAACWRKMRPFEVSRSAMPPPGVSSTRYRSARRLRIPDRTSRSVWKACSRSTTRRGGQPWFCRISCRISTWRGSGMKILGVSYTIACIDRFLGELRRPEGAGAGPAFPVACFSGPRHRYPVPVVFLRQSGHSFARVQRTG